MPSDWKQKPLRAPFWFDRAGGTATITALAASLAVGLAAVGVEISTTASGRASLQALADEAAVAGARELALASGDTFAAKAAEAYALSLESQLALKPGSLRAKAILHEDFDKVEIRLEAKKSLSLLSGLSGEHQILHARAVAQAVGDRSLCIVALREQDRALRIAGNGEIQAGSCQIQANSISSNGIMIEQRGKITAHRVYSAGGYRGSASALSSDLHLDAPMVEDPLRDRQVPSHSNNCDFQDQAARNGSQSSKWKPGIYCGGMYLNNGARIELSPGTYILRGGSLNVEGNAQLLGKGVTLILTKGARINFLARSRLDLSAPATGPTAGILFFGDRENPIDKADYHNFSSDDARNLLGLIYLPDARLIIRSKNPVADQSPWTAIVAKQIEILDKAKVHLNARYDETDVPLPDGLRGPSESVQLID